MLEKKRSLLLFYAIAALQGMVFYASIATLYRQAVGVTLLQITMIESVSLVLSVALEVPWGAAADRLGYRKTLMVCAFLFFASKVVFWQAEGVGGFLLERMLLAVTLSGLSGCDSAYLYLCAGEQGSHKAYSRWELASAAGMLVASGVFTLFLGTRYRLAALLTVLTYGAAAVLSLGLGEVPSPPKMTARAHLADVRSALARSLPLLPVLLAATFLRETGQIVTVFFSPLLYLRGGIPIPLFGLLHGGDLRQSGHGALPLRRGDGPHLRRHESRSRRSGGFGRELCPAPLRPALLCGGHRLSPLQGATHWGTKAAT